MFLDFLLQKGTAKHKDRKKNLKIKIIGLKYKIAI